MTVPEKISNNTAAMIMMRLRLIAGICTINKASTWLAKAILNSTPMTMPMSTDMTTLTNT